MEIEVQTLPTQRGQESHPVQSHTLITGQESLRVQSHTPSPTHAK